MIQVDSQVRFLRCRSPIRIGFCYEIFQNSEKKKLNKVFAASFNNFFTSQCQMLRFRETHRSCFTSEDKFENLSPVYFIPVWFASFAASESIVIYCFHLKQTFSQSD